MTGGSLSPSMMVSDKKELLLVLKLWIDGGRRTRRRRTSERRTRKRRTVNILS